MSKKFKVVATMTTYLTAEIEAEDVDQAYEIAHDLDGGQFTPIPDTGDWEIYEVTIKETIMKTYSQQQDIIRARKQELLETNSYVLRDEPPAAFYDWDSLSQIRYIDKHGEWLA